MAMPTCPPQLDRRRWCARQRGSVAAELTLVTPFLVALLVFVAVLVHRGVDARLRLNDAAHQAARAASIERDPSRAIVAARTTAEQALAAAGVVCQDLTVDTDTGAMAPGGVVAVTLTCRVNLTDASLLKLGDRSLSASASEPIDEWRSTVPAGNRVGGEP